MKLGGFKDVGELLFGLGVKDEIKYLELGKLGRKIQVKFSKRTNLAIWFGFIQKSSLNSGALHRLFRL